MKLKLSRGRERESFMTKSNNYYTTVSRFC